MARKIYESIGISELMVRININGKGYSITFSGGVTYDNRNVPAIYVTDNPLVQQELDKPANGYGRCYRLKAVIESEPEKESKETSAGDNVLKYKKVQELRVLLEKELPEVTMRKNISEQEMLEIAKQNNITVQRI